MLCQIAIGVALCCMSCEAKSSPSLRFLKNIVKDEGAYKHVDDVRKAAPSMSWHIRCYHNVSLDA